MDNIIKEFPNSKEIKMTICGDIQFKMGEGT